MKKADPFVRNILLLFAGIGLILLIVAYFLYRSERQFLDRSVRVPGEVVALKDGGDVYYPVFRFCTEESEPVEVTGRVGSNPAAFRVGEAVLVYYDPDQPNHAEVESFFTQWLAVIITGGIGGAFQMPWMVGLGILLWKNRSSVTD